MHKILFTILTYLLSSLVKRILIGAGLALVSSNVLLGLINRYMVHAQGKLDFAYTLPLHFLGLCGADVAISILVGALIARATIEATKVGLKKI